jgi:hypothetical protein
MLQMESQPTSRQVENQRPFEIAVAISAHNDYAGSNRPQLFKNRFRANIAKMPDFISVLGHLLYAVRQTIVRVGQNEDEPGFVGFCVRSHLLFLPTRGSREEYRRGYDKTRLALCVILTALACYKVSGADLRMM